MVDRSGAAGSGNRQSRQLTGDAAGPAPLVLPPWLPAPDPSPSPGPRAPGPPLPAEAAPASYGGNVGPVGSQQELRQLGLITGQAQPASVVTDLLLGPVARGTEVSMVPAQDEPVAGPK